MGKLHAGVVDDQAGTPPDVAHRHDVMARVRTHREPVRLGGRPAGEHGSAAGDGEAGGGTVAGRGHDRAQGVHIFVDLEQRVGLDALADSLTAEPQIDDLLAAGDALLARAEGHQMGGDGLARRISTVLTHTPKPADPPAHGVRSAAPRLRSVSRAHAHT